jgi:hypothetical protein
MSRKVIVDSPQPSAPLSRCFLACGRALGGVALRGKLVQNQGNANPRIEIPGFLVSFLPLTDLTAFWMLMFDLNQAPLGEYTLRLHDEWTGKGLAAVEGLTLDLSHFDPVFVQIAPDPANPLPGQFGVTLQSGTQNPAPTLSLAHVNQFNAVLVGSFGTGPYNFGYQCTASGWDGTTTQLVATQTGVGAEDSVDLTFQAGV